MGEVGHFPLDHGDLAGDLLDLGDVSQDLEALSPTLVGDISEDSAAECDYDNISSPGGSSTCSGPTYKRHLGFGPEVQRCAGNQDQAPNTPPSPSRNPALSRHRLSSQTSLEPRPRDSKKKKKKSLLCPSYEDSADEIKGVQIERPGGTKTSGAKLGTFTSSRSRNKKEPLPMKMRALPQSFWQQPNNANPLSPGAVFSVLPPLPGQAGPEAEIFSHVPGLTEVAGQEAQQMLDRKSEQKVTEANTDLLFSLFNGVEEEESQRKIHLVRRGRPKKPPPNFSRTRLLQDEDPYLVSNMTESILPLIPERNVSSTSSSQAQNNNNNNKQSATGTQVIKIMSISHGDKSVDLPSLNIEHNYPHLLSELVMKL